MTSRAAVVGRRIVVYAPFAAKDAIKAIPSRTWDAVGKAWTFPATPAAADAIQRACPGIVGDEAFEQLAKRHRAGLEALDPALDPPPVEDEGPMPLFRHQRVGLRLIAGRGSCYLAHDMGTGKTRTVIEAVNRMALRRVLIVCPKSVAAAWANEWMKWGRTSAGGMPPIILALDRGSVVERARKVESMLRTAGQRVLAVVVNYDAAWRAPLGPLLLAQEWDMIVADEIHRIKEPGRGDYGAIMRRKEAGAQDGAAVRSHGVTSLFMAAMQGRTERRVGLSGTPIPNNLLDLWAQMRFVDPGAFQTNYGAFLVKYAVRGGYAGKQVIGFRGTDEINRIFYSLAHRVKKDDVLDLPEATHVERVVTLSERAREIYDRVEDSFVATLPNDCGEITIKNALVELLRLQQIAGGMAKMDDGREIEVDTAKRDALEDIFEDLPPGEPIVVFCRFRHDLAAVHNAAHAAGRHSVELSGSANDLARWQQAGACAEPSVLAVQVQSGGLGVDLTRARYAVFYSLGFSLGEYEQALARLHRMGQRRNVEYIHLVAEGTVDRKVYGALRRKAKVVEAVLADLKAESRAIISPPSGGKEAKA